MRTLKLLLVLVILGIALPQVAVAQEMKNDIGFVVSYLSPTGDYTDSFGDKIEADSAIGFGGAYKHRLNETMSFGASIMFANHDVTACSMGICVKGGEVTNVPILFDLNYHFPTAGDVDPYIGFTLGYSLWGDLEYVAEVGEPDESIDGSFNYGLNFGLDFPMSNDWKVVVGARYLVQEAESSESAGETVDVDPFIVSIGIARGY